MNGTGLTASDVMALTNGNDMFGGASGFILLFIFLMALSGNGFGWGNNAVANSFAYSDLQNSLYAQSQDNAIRSLAQGQCAITDTILNNKYDNAVLIKDVSNQISNSVAGIGSLIAEQGNQTRALIQSNYISELSDKLQTTRDELSNARQTAVITENILSNLATTAPKPPCYYGCGCGSSLY